MSRLAESLKEMREIQRRMAARINAWSDIRSERLRQDVKFGYQHRPHYNNDSLYYWRNLRAAAKKNTDNRTKAGTVTWEDILHEEICEAFAETEWSKRRAELIQCAAVIVAEIEDGDLNG